MIDCDGRTRYSPVKSSRRFRMDRRVLAERAYCAALVEEFLSQVLKG
jgi:hypothetical protein